MPRDNEQRFDYYRGKPIGECGKHPGHNMVGCALCVIASLNPNQPKNSLRMDPDLPGSVSVSYGPPDMFDDGTTRRRGCVDDPFDSLDRHKPREYPFPDLGGTYGYCPACKKPQGDSSHAWIHACTSDCDRPCNFVGRAVFMCQRPDCSQELMDTLVSIDAHPPKPVPPENLVFKASKAPKMPTKEV